MILNKNTYQNSFIRDLEFLLTSELLISKFEDISFPPEELIQTLISDSENVLKAMDTDNSIIMDLMKAKQLRLGHYCEELLGAYFNAHPKIEVLEKNWQIHREGITVGEIDFILKTERGVVGLETAFKCYFNDDQGVFGWVGPHRKDSLGDKLMKVKEKQLPLFQSEEVHARYGQIPAYFFVKGHLFGSRLEEASSSLKSSEFSTIEVGKVAQILDVQSTYFIFPKLSWVSEFQLSPKEYKVPIDRVKSRIEDIYATKKSCILGIRSKNKNENYLIVADAE